MWNSVDYDYALNIENYKSRLEIASRATNSIHKMLGELCKSITNDDADNNILTIEQIKIALIDLEMFLMKK
jgi:hypothetical protein